MYPINKIFFLCLLLAAILFVPASAFATLTSLTNPGGQSVVFDDAQNLYWFQSPGSFANSYWGGSYGEVTNNINQINTTSYYGISNWHLASSLEFSNLLGNGYNQVTANFSPTNITSGTETVPGSPPVFCIPNIFGGGSTCYGGTPDQYVDYTRTTWSGLLSDTTSITRTTVIPDPNPFCGYFFSPPCNPTSENVTDPAHLVGEINLTDYEAGQMLRTDYLSWNYLSARDSGIAYYDYNWGGYDASPIFGAWVIGSLNPTSGVPEPSSMLLLVSGLIGFYFVKKKMK